MKSFKVMTFVVLFILTTLSAMAQRVQVTVGYVNSEIRNPVEAIQNARTVSADAKIFLVNRSGWKLGPAFNYQRAYDVEVVPESSIYPKGLYRDVDIYFGGVELSKKIGPVEPGGGFFLGTRDLGMGRQTVRKYRGFVDVVAFKHFVIRLFSAEAEVTGGFNANRATKYGAGAGFRF